MQRLTVICLVATVSTMTLAQTPATYQDSRRNKVAFPLGALSFADEVVAFEPGKPQAGLKDRDPHQALDTPNYKSVQAGNYASLGCAGVLTLRFTDNVLVDVKGPDLYVFEVGPAIEPLRLEISPDGQRWTDIGKIEGGTASVDIAPHVKPGEVFRYVRLTDLKSECSGGTPGADIDAVGAIGAGLQVSLNSAVLFDTDRFDLKPEAQKELSRVIALIREQKGGAAVAVEGHTDAVGQTDYNQTLSANRARSVVEFLQTNIKSAAVRFSSSGHGETRPVATNDSEEGRAKNRRVEITIVPEGNTPRQ